VLKLAKVSNGRWPMLDPLLCYGRFVDLVRVDPIWRERLNIIWNNTFRGQMANIQEHYKSCQ